MILLNSSTEILHQLPGLDGVYKQIELAGRVSYKSENRIDSDSSKKFVDMLISRGHLCPLEQGTIYLKINTDYYSALDLIEFYDTNPYSRTKFVIPEKITDSVVYYVTTNARVIVENDRIEDLKYMCEPTEHHIPRITARIICDRAVGNEIVRHRAFSFVQESSRYCNYSKDKFGGEVRFIIPHWVELKPGVYSRIWYDIEEDVNKIIIDNEVHQFINDIPYTTQMFINNCSDCEDHYLKSIEDGLTPQQARNMLPLSLKTEIVMTGFIDDWKHFFDLRTANDAHPDIQVIAKELKNKIIC